MKTLRIHNILTESGTTIEDIMLQVPVDYDWVMVFDMLMEKTGFEIDSYSYEEINHGS